MSEVLCSRINYNLKNLNHEYQSVRDDLSAEQGKLDNLEPRLADAEYRLDAIPSHSLPGAVMSGSPAGRVGSLALSVFDAVATENARADASGQVDRLHAEVEATPWRIEEFERQLGDKEWAISNQQGAFAGNGWFDLGFSHEVMNFPG